MSRPTINALYDTIGGPTFSSKKMESIDALTIQSLIFPAMNKGTN